MRWWEIGGDDGFVSPQIMIDRRPAMFDGFSDPLRFITLAPFGLFAIAGGWRR
jgi:hypothetical protein